VQSFQLKISSKKTPNPKNPKEVFGNNPTKIEK
jgi:hypothetical protein